MVARLQKTVVLAVLLIAAASIVFLWPRWPWLALLCATAALLGYAAILALEFCILYTVHGNDAVPRATPSQLWRAWSGEVCTGLQVFFWRQPFRPNQLRDVLSGASGSGRGVVFVHGLFCNRGFWTPWMARVQASGRACMAVTLEPISGSIDGYAAVIDDAVTRMAAATGEPPLVVCHSMGGLAVRAWLCRHQAWSRVAHVVTIGTPHAGTWMARFGHGANGHQMRLRSTWLTAMAERQTAAHGALFTCWYSNADNIVFPASTATLPGADNRLVPGIAHVALAFHPTVMRESLAML